VTPRRIRFLAAAAAELSAAVDRYEAEREGLGLDFATEIERFAQQLLQHPNSGTAHTSNTRRVVLGRFPYGVVYRVGVSDITIIAIAHHRRRPGYWRSRAGPL
jgi:toxin ParE1/3/4